MKFMLMLLLVSSLVASLEADDLLDWQTFARLRGLLRDVRLTFPLRKTKP